MGNGIRYGVSWQYNGKEVLVRTMNGQLETYYGDILLVKHQLQYRTGRIVWLPGQYKGLAERKGIAAAYPATQQQQLWVEVCSLLNFYDFFLEGGESHG